MATTPRRLEPQVMYTLVAQDFKNRHVGPDLPGEPVPQFQRDEGVDAEGMRGSRRVDVLDRHAERARQFFRQRGRNDGRGVWERIASRQEGSRVDSVFCIGNGRREGNRAADLVQVCELALAHPVRRFQTPGRHRGGYVESRDDLARRRRRDAEVRIAVAVQEGQQFRVAERQDAVHLDRLAHPRSLGGVADVFDDAQIERDGLLPVRDPVTGQGVLVCVAGGVVCLADVPRHAADGGQEDEEVQVRGQQVVQVPGAGDFGCDGFGEGFEGHALEFGVLFSSKPFCQSLFEVPRYNGY